MENIAIQFPSFVCDGGHGLQFTVLVLQERSDATQAHRAADAPEAQAPGRAHRSTRKAGTV